MAALTDSVNSVSYDPISRPGVSNLLQLLAYFSEEAKTAEQLAQQHASMGLAELKRLLADAISEGLESIRGRFQRIMAEDDGKLLDAIEADGAKKARMNADETMILVREAVGF
jgi:tryptophanyl-tRNA synthetase